MIDTDNDYTTGYSSLGTGIGAEKMIEIKGVHGIITLRVVKEWTGTDVNDWSWSEGVAVDAAASGSELELEVPNGKYWIHIISWDGDQDSSTDFDLNKDEGRYVNSGSNCYFYYRMNSNSYVDSCGSTSAGGSLESFGGAAYGSGIGYIDGGVDMQGSEDYFKGADTNIDITADWSFETWVNTDDSNDGTIFFIGDNDGTFQNQNELSIGFASGDELELCYSDAPFSECDLQYRVRTSNVDFNTNQWYHIAVVHDDSAGDITVFVNGVAVVVNDATAIENSPSGANDIYFGESDYSGHDDFDGQIDEVRMVNYEKRAFAAGLMLSKIVPSTNSITIYNNNAETMDLTGIEIYKDGGSTPSCTTSGTLASGQTKDITGCTLMMTMVFT